MQLPVMEQVARTEPEISYLAFAIRSVEVDVENNLAPRCNIGSQAFASPSSANRFKAC